MSSRVTTGRFNNEGGDELSKHLEQRIGIESFDENPLTFRYEC